ncbi:DUF4147 domain-containing protein [Stygiolobus caldivivus]|uniref:Glycerate kinase n=1 Tax=Stygiolobus caldivivus TaxID=2824673 RepID=A0A8D5ZDK4_9CREN|nr:DUF4147 domain-containing protein [Stygiolobus caldivivus]BCU69163.1 glycerate kinase [Stygiolobus caldivivus]
MQLGEKDKVINELLKYSDSYSALKDKVTIRGNIISVNSSEFVYNNPILISVGKSSIKMAKFFLEHTPIKKGIIITPEASHNERFPLDVFISTHPEISERSLEAGRKVVELLTKEDYDLVIFLISGGASALMEYSDIPLDVLKEINMKLITSGLGIDQINTIRKHLSLIKGGWMLKYSKSPILTFVISDVPGGDLTMVGSGPTLIDQTTKEDAENVLRSIGLGAYSVYLKETPKTSKVKSYVYKVLDVESVLIKLKNTFQQAEVLSSEIRGDAYSFGIQLAGIANTLSRLREGKKILLFGGEPDVKITGKHGKGGRNGEVCLGFLKYIKTDAILYAFATDGIDGNSDYAGCYVSDQLRINSLEIEEAIETHSSYELLERYGSVIKTGYTGNNVNNIYLLEIS